MVGRRWLSAHKYMLGDDRWTIADLNVEMKVEETKGDETVAPSPMAFLTRLMTLSE